MGKCLIINADNFGISKSANNAILEGYNNGFLKSASLCVNGEAFSAAVNDILPECPQLSLGITLNVIKGKSLTNCNLVTNKKGYFNKNFLYYMLNSSKNILLTELEDEFRAQIERGLNIGKIEHIRSFNQIHSIPHIFNLVAKLAYEYNIPFIQTHKENFYTLPSYKKAFNLFYPINIVKSALLNIYTQKNNILLRTYDNLNTNTNLLGILSKGITDIKTIENGLIANAEDNSITEITISPDKSNKKHKQEILIMTDKTFEYTINRLDFKNTNYKNL